MTEYTGKLGDYSLGKKLGSGQFSKVRIGTKAGQNYAVKYMLKSNDLFKNKTILELVFNEAKIMLQLNHPNIVKLYEFSEKGVISKSSGKEVPVLYLIFELISGGEIFDYVAVGGRFSDQLCRFYFKQLIDALEHLYSKGYAHRDIKAENILLDDKGNLKLADFGFATLMKGKDGSGKLYSQKGTLGYMAPEIAAGQPYSGEKVDLFAVGVLLFTMAAQHPPFRKATVQDPFYKMFCQQNEVFWAKMSTNKPKDTFSPTFKSLVNALMAYSPTARPTIAAIKEHPWYKEFTPTLEGVQSEIMNRRIKVEMEWKEKAAEEAEKKKMKKAMEMKSKAAAGMFAPHIATKAAMEASKKVTEEVKRVLKDYKPVVHEQTTMFSVDNANEILDGMTKCLGALGAKVDIVSGMYKVF